MSLKAVVCHFQPDEFCFFLCDVLHLFCCAAWILRDPGSTVPVLPCQTTASVLRLASPEACFTYCLSARCYSVTEELSVYCYPSGWNELFPKIPEMILLFCLDAFR